MKILIRTKGGMHYGMGHVLRSIALARAMPKAWQVLFLIDQDRNTKRLLNKNNLNFKILKSKNSSKITLNRFDPDAVFIDILSPGNSEVKFFRKYSDRIIVIDDMEKLKAKGVILVHPQKPFFCREFSKNKSMVLEGTKYMIMRSVFRHDRTRKMRKTLKRICISLGSTSYSKACRIAKWLDAGLTKDIKIDLLSGIMPKDAPCIEFSKRVNMVPFTNKAHDYIYKSDLGIIAGGFTKFEFMRYGIPFIIVAICKHQDVLGRIFFKAGLGKYVGMLNKLTKGTLISMIESMQRNYTYRNRLSGKLRYLVDGKAAQRLIALAAK